MTTSFMNAEAEKLIEAAYRVRESITEEQVHELASYLGTITNDPSIENEFAAAMLDLGQAAQDYEASEDIG